MGTPTHTLVITSPLEAACVDRIRAVASSRIDVIFEPDLLPRPRYAGDHDGDGNFRRLPAQEARWNKALARATILWDFPTPAQDGGILALVPNLRWVQTTSSGVGRHVHSLGLADSDVIVTTARGVHANALAEFVFLILLGDTKNHRRLMNDQAQKQWERYCGGTLAGKTITIVGAGQIGTRIGRVAKAFGMTVVAIVNHPSPSRCADLNADKVLGPSELKQAVSLADYVILSTPHTPQTDRLIDRDVIAAMKRGVVLVNIARGHVVDEEAMTEALIDGQIGFAGLDVATVEPLPPASPLWNLPNVLVSPHSASTDPDENRKIADIFCKNMGHFLDGHFDRMINLLDKKRMY